MITTENLDPFAAAGRNGEIPPNSPPNAISSPPLALAELHRRWVALAVERDRLRGEWHEARYGSLATLPPGVIGGKGMPLSSDEAIDREIDDRIAASRNGARAAYWGEQLERQRLWLKEELARAKAVHVAALEECGGITRFT